MSSAHRPITSKRMILIAIAIAAYAVLLSLHANRDTDPFWHMGLARSVIKEGHRVVQEPWSFIGAASARPVPEWGWGLLLLAAYNTAGWTGISMAVALCAALSAVVVVGLLWRWVRDDSTAAQALVATIVVSLLSARYKSRPEILAFSFLGAGIVLAEAWRNAHGARRMWLGASLLTVELMWAQVHGSFILLPAVFLVVGWLPLGGPWRWRSDLALIGILCVGLYSSAWGTDILSYIGKHSQGDAVRHILDMVKPTFDVFNPINHIFGPGWLLLISLGVMGMLWTRTIYVRELLLALLGLALFSDAVRFVSFAGLLAGPFALRGTTDLVRDTRGGPFMAVLFAVLWAGWTIQWQDVRSGPLGHGGLAEDAFPVAGAARLAMEPPGLRVLSSYTAGAPIGFWLGGRVKTWVDSRTPLHFDDTEYAMSRDGLASAAAIRRAARRYNAGAVVIERTSPACADVAKEWVTVAVDPDFTTFLAPGAAPLAGLAPCGADYLAADACENNGLDAALQWLRTFAPTPFLDYLEAERADRCNRGQAVSPPQSSPLTVWGPARDRLVARELIASGQVNAAVDLLEPAVTAGDLTALAVLGPALFGPPVHPRARALLEGLSNALDDSTPGDVRADLAWICSQEGDVECARFQGLRAAAKGSGRSLEVLQWLSEHDTSEEYRGEAAAWIRALSAGDP